MEFPRHDCGLHLTHNNHKDYYQTVEQYIKDIADRSDEDEGEKEDWVSDEQRTKAIETNEMWELTWYPDTPVGSFCLWASDLEVLLKAANELQEAEDGGTHG